MDYSHTVNTTKTSIIGSFVFILFATSLFFVLEPSIGRSATDSFLVSQTITDEISFTVASADVTMVGSIAGLTGGYATGTTYVVVRSNDSLGYNMTLAFSSTTAMSATTSGHINNYTPTATTAPDFLWVDNTSGQAAEFGYTVRASTSGEVDPSFMNDGSTCNTGATETNDRCWQNPSTTPETIVNVSSAVVSSTTTIKFKVAVPSSPSPALPSGVYIATGTLTATNN